jgi:hypothetical protein
MARVKIINADAMNQVLCTRTGMPKYSPSFVELVMLFRYSINAGDKSNKMCGRFSSDCVRIEMNSW